MVVVNRKNMTAKIKPTVRVWGLAAGRGSTSEAARGAFTCREYTTQTVAYEIEIPRQDWLKITFIEPI
jgi:hypothetical protein